MKTIITIANSTYYLGSNCGIPFKFAAFSISSLNINIKSRQNEIENVSIVCTYQQKQRLESAVIALFAYRLKSRITFDLVCFHFFPKNFSFLQSIAKFKHQYLVKDYNVYAFCFISFITPPTLHANEENEAISKKKISNFSKVCY